MSSSEVEFDQPYIEFDIDEIEDLKKDYEATMEFILEELPPVNWNSRVEAKAYFSDEYGIALYSLRLQDLSDTISQLGPFGYGRGDIEQCKDELNGLLEYLKLKYTTHNYLDCILRHHKQGKVYLRSVDGIWKLPNKQPVPQCPELTRCIIGSKNKGE